MTTTHSEGYSLLDDILNEIETHSKVCASPKAGQRAHFQPRAKKALHPYAKSAQLRGRNAHYTRVNKVNKMLNEQLREEFMQFHRQAHSDLDAESFAMEQKTTQLCAEADAEAKDDRRA